MSEDSLPLRQWPAGIQQASVPANDNALRVQALLSRAVSVENDAPGTQINGDVYIVGDSPAGAFSQFSEHDIALFEFSSWYAWSPVVGTSMVVGTSRMMFDGTEWIADPAGGGGGSGDVVGPATSTAGNFALFADTTGKEIEDGGTPGGMAFEDDAPSDGQEYVRKDGDWAVATGGGGGGGLTNWTEAVNTASPNDTVPVVSLTVNNAATNVDLAISPKGAGAVSAHVATGTATGGNKRGANSVDWQTARSAANRVASGQYGTIAGGFDNIAGGQSSSVGGGSTNTSNGTGTTISGGRENVATQDYSTIGGGRSNETSAAHATVGGGQSNQATAAHSTVAGGQGNQATGAHSSVGGGTVNFATGEGSWIAGGLRATTRSLYGAGARASGQFSALGDAQSMCHVLRAATTSAATANATANGSTAGGTNQVVVPNNSCNLVKATVVVREAATGDSAAWDVRACVKRGANAAATSLVGTPAVTSLAADAGAAAWAVAVVADTTNGALQFQVTGEASHTLRWVVDVYSCAQVVG